MNQMFGNAWMRTHMSATSSAVVPVRLVLAGERRPARTRASCQSDA